jgi:hypothetical protein
MEGAQMSRLRQLVITAVTALAAVTAASTAVAVPASAAVTRAAAPAALRAAEVGGDVQGLGAAIGRYATAAPSATGTADAGVAADVTTGNDSAGTDSAGDPCETSWAKETEHDALGFTLFWFKLSTYWCWNYSIVTYHNTYSSYNITTLGGDSGWVYNGTDGIHFNCYIASGSTRKCSGNYESTTAYFQDCIVKYGCVQNVYFYIEEWENYKGQFFTNV